VVKWQSCKVAESQSLPAALSRLQSEKAKSYRVAKAQSGKV